MKLLGKEHQPTRKKATLVVGWNIPFVETTEEQSRGLSKTSELSDCLERIDRQESVWVGASRVALFSSSLGSLNPLIEAVMLARPDCPIVLAFTDRVAGVTKWAPPVYGATSSLNDLRTRLYDLTQEVFLLRPGLNENLGLSCLRGLKRKWFRPVIIDGFQNGRELRGGQLLAASWRLAVWIRQNVSEKRLGIVLPPGLGATVANLACTLANVTAVNLNFTAGRLVNEAALKRAEVKQVFTAEAMRSKVKDFPWPEQTIDLKDLLTSFSKLSLAWRWLVGMLLPASVLRQVIGVSEAAGDQEGALLFTSGSVGDPKGVILSHRNLQANVSQIAAVLSRGPIRSLLACLPIFHSFGCTVTFWWPIMGGPTGITYVSPTETVKLVELVKKYQIDLLLNTPTFLRNFLRKAEAADLASLEVVIAGAEKLPFELREEFEQKFSRPVCEGYGMSEASPVVAVNLIEFGRQPGTAEYESPRRLGSVGRLLPGISIRIRDPETQEILPLSETGMIWLQGANLFPGYLLDPEQSAQVLVDGWYCTGDLGRLDVDGFLFVEGRISRFSKIAGEMVPHGVVEEKLNQIYRAHYGEEFLAAIVSLPDSAKGEILIALVNRPIEPLEARKSLSQIGLPNLWAPKEYRLIESIPMLATGKLDLKACQKLVSEGREAP